MDALRTIGLLGLCLIGLTLIGSTDVHAQDRDTRTSPVTGSGYVWRLTAGGDVLAAVPESNSKDATLVLAPLEPAIAADGVNLATGLGGVLNVPLTEASRLTFGAGQQWVVATPQRAAPWCGNVTGLLAYSAGAHECVGPADDARLPALSRNQASVGFATDRFDVSLGYGVTTGHAGAFQAPASAPLGIDYLGLAAAHGRDANGQDVALSGTWRFSPLTALRVTAAIGETTLREPLAPWTDFEHAAFGVGLSRGAFSGNLVGRVVRGPATAIEPAWGGLDLGVAWRTPWRGELSFGARNLLSTGPEPGVANPAEAELDRDTARTPYVQYKQDL